MRLPLRHRPPDGPDPLRRCAHLERLAEALIGVPLGPAATLLSSRRSRGRHGNAVQWHLGLSPHDGLAELDWEDRIEVKLLTVWGKGADLPSVGCDKLKVCDVSIDPWRKLSNVLFVHADRLTRVVVGASLFHLSGGPLRRLAASWDVDPHFEHPDLFVEARETEGRSAPAYYVSARWLAEEGLVPPPQSPIFRFDPGWWTAARTEHGRDPLLTIIDAAQGPVVCPRCGGAVSFDADRVERDGWGPARHGMPLGDSCAVTAHAVVLGDRLRHSSHCAVQEFTAGLEGRVAGSGLWRLADRVEEPEDHLH